MSEQDAVLLTVADAPAHTGEHGIASSASYVDGNHSKLQFSAPIFYAKERDDDHMILDVVRFGPADKRVSCKYATSDGDGKAGHRYVATKGEVVFEVGVSSAQISIPITYVHRWLPTQELACQLSDPSGCTLGNHLNHCRIKVIDSHWFPTQHFAKKMEAGHWESIPLFPLLGEYIKFNYASCPLICRRTKQVIFSDQIHNAYFILNLWVQKVLIDRILKPYDAGHTQGCAPGEQVFGPFIDCPDHTQGRDALIDSKFPLLIICAATYVVPVIVVHYIEYWQVFLKLGGTSRKTLQSNLVKCFLNYDDRSRNQLGTSDLIMACGRDASNVVHDGYMQVFPLAQNAGRLLFLLAFQLCLKQYQAMIPVLIYPILLFTFLRLRSKQTGINKEQANTAQNHVLNYIAQISTRHHLIGDYQRRPEAIQETDARIGAYNGKQTVVNAENKNNHYFHSWLTAITIGLWYIVGGLQVLDGGEIGMFITNLAIFKSVGHAWGQIFNVMLNMQESLPHLLKITTFMNLASDLPKRRVFARRRRAMGEEARLAARNETIIVDKNSVAADRVPIVMRDVCYAHEAPEGVYMRKMAFREGRVLDEKDVPSSHSLQHYHLEIPQGVLVAMVGGAGDGKATLMKLLGSQLIPDLGDLLIPAHLRVLHVSAHARFFNDTLLANLRYGCDKDSDDASIPRITAILKKVGVHEKLFKYIDAKHESSKAKCSWEEMFSVSERAKLSLARAFISNPEVLVIHTPTASLDDHESHSILNLLSEFVRSKGLALDDAKQSSRRPRTCIVTTTRPKTVQVADLVFQIEPTAIRRIPKETALHTAMPLSPSMNAVTLAPEKNRANFTTL